VVEDWQRIFPGEILNLLGRAQPEKLTLYSTASILANSYTTGKPKRLSEKMNRKINRNEILWIVQEKGCLPGHLQQNRQDSWITNRPILKNKYAIRRFFLN